MKKRLTAFLMLTIGLFASVAGFSNTRDGTIAKMESVYEIKIGETAKDMIQAYDPPVNAVQQFSVSEVVEITNDFSLVKVKKYEGVLTSGPDIPETISFEIPYGTYLLKDYATILPPLKERFRRDKTTLTVASHAAWNGPVTIRMLLC